MPNDKKKNGARDRRKVVGEESYEAQHFAERNDISIAEARELIELYGSNRDKLEQQASRLKKDRPKR